MYPALRGGVKAPHQGGGKSYIYRLAHRYDIISSDPAYLSVGQVRHDVFCYQQLTCRDTIKVHIRVKSISTLNAGC